MITFSDGPSYNVTVTSQHNTDVTDDIEEICKVLKYLTAL